MNDNVLKSQAFKLKGRLYTLTVMQLMSDNLDAFAVQLQEVIAQAPKLFQHIPIVLDCTLLPEATFDLQGFCQCLREHQVLPVAVQGANALLATLAQCQGLAVLTGSTTQDKAVVEAALEPTPVMQQKTKMHLQPVRSGQQVVAKGSDLLVIASVSPGAEVLAEGNIHIYGSLRGRALAGISGDRQARIFCQALEAELLAIAGVYRLADASEIPKGPCQVFLEDDRIVIESLSL